MDQVGTLLDPLARRMMLALEEQTRNTSLDSQAKFAALAPMICMNNTARRPDFRLA